jgi:16S rRNA (uracil1498-N3)-methyltransferase
VAPLEEDREAPIPLQAWIPLTAQLSLVDEMLPPLVELGASLLQPVIYTRSEYDSRKTLARLERWQRIVLAACEQSHRTRVPDLRQPVPFEALLALDLPQKWVAYERKTNGRNPMLESQAIAFTSGPEGGITDGEFAGLRNAGWKAVSLGQGILRAVTAPVAMLGAIQHQLSK